MSEFPNASTALATVVVDELIRHGVEMWVGSPGSRSTALVLAISRRPEAQLAMAIDERSAGFHALGWSKATGRPAVVVTTSGSAVAHLLPAVVEADLAGARLLVITADRPPEMRSVGANQTIDQAHIFERYLRGGFELGPAERHPSAPRWWRSVVSQAAALAGGANSGPGPVHLNLAFREPTVGVSDDGRSRDDPYPFDGAGRSDGAPWTVGFGSTLPARESLDGLVAMMSSVERGVIVAGAGTAPEVAQLGDRIGWPVLATAESGLRSLSGVIATGHHLVSRVDPEAVVRFGSTGPSSRILGLCSGEARQAVISPMWSDPARSAEVMIIADPGQVARALIDMVEPREGDWLPWWRHSDRLVRTVLAEATSELLDEPLTAVAVGRLDPDPLVVASSMPIRDLEAFAFDVGRVVANRGASGIDGLVSTALGAARTGPRPLALTGDLSLFHDSNGFLVDDLPGCVFVVIDNRGGGIFSFLPQGWHVGREFERLFATPAPAEVADLARLHGLTLVAAGTTGELEAAVREGWEAGERRLVVVKSDRTENVAVHQRLDRLVEAAVGKLASPP